MSFKKLLFTVFLLVTLLGISTQALAEDSDSILPTPTLVPIKEIDKTELRISFSVEPSSFDFQHIENSMDLNMYNYLMEGLTRLNSTGTPEPGIASSWETSGDGLTWTFHLRNALWSDGVPLRGEDFRAGCLRSLAPSNPSSYAYLLDGIVGATDYRAGLIPADSVGISVPNGETIVFRLTHPVAYFDALVSMPAFSPIRGDSITDGILNGNLDGLVLNGPFLLSKWEKGISIQLKKNPTYWAKDRIRLEKVSGAFFQDLSYSEKIEKYLAGELDLLDYVDSTSFKELGKGNIASYIDGSVWYLDFNCNSGVLANKNIRKALSLGISRSTYLKAAYPDRKYVSALSLVAPNVIPGVTGTTFREESPYLFKDNDKAVAREYLRIGMEELGIKKFPTVTLLVNNTVLSHAGGDALVEMWKKNLGIKIKLKAVTPESRLLSLSTSKYQITLSGWGPDYPDPMTYLDIFRTGNPMNESHYSNRIFDEYLDLANSSADKASRFDALHRAEALLMDDMPICPLFFRNSTYSAKPYVKGVTGSAFSPTLNFIYAYLE